MVTINKGNLFSHPLINNQIKQNNQLCSLSIWQYFKICIQAWAKATLKAKLNLVFNVFNKKIHYQKILNRTKTRLIYYYDTAN